MRIRVGLSSNWQSTVDIIVPDSLDPDKQVRLAEETARYWALDHIPDAVDHIQTVGWAIVPDSEVPAIYPTDDAWYSPLQPEWHEYESEPEPIDPAFCGNTAAHGPHRTPDNGIGWCGGIWT